MSRSALHIPLGRISSARHIRVCAAGHTLARTSAKAVRATRRARLNQGSPRTKHTTRRAYPNHRLDHTRTIALSRQGIVWNYMELHFKPSSRNCPWSPRYSVCLFIILHYQVSRISSIYLLYISHYISAYTNYNIILTDSLQFN